MSDWDVAPSWEYSRWTKNYARNCRITEPTNILPYVGELAKIITTLKIFWNPVMQSGSRPWLQAAFQKKAVQVPTDLDYQCDLDSQPTHVLIELLEVVGRDLKKLPTTAGEAMFLGFLFSSAPERVFGTEHTFGNVGGSIVHV